MGRLFNDRQDTAPSATASTESHSRPIDTADPAAARSSSAAGRLARQSLSLCIFSTPGCRTNSVMAERFSIGR